MLDETIVQDYPLDEKAYRAWIALLDAQATVGITHDCTQCALAHYLQTTYNQPFAVKYSPYGILYGPREISMERYARVPAWADEEVEVFDRLEDVLDIDVSKDTPITITKAMYLEGMALYQQQQQQEGGKRSHEHRSRLQIYPEGGVGRRIKL